MLNIAYTHASVILVIFHYHMLQNKQSNRLVTLIKQYDFGGCVICMCNKVEYLDKERRFYLWLSRNLDTILKALSCRRYFCFALLVSTRLLLFPIKLMEIFISYA